MGRHETVSHLVRGDIRGIFIESLEAADRGSVLLAKRLCKFNHLLKHGFNVIRETKFEAGKNGASGTLEKPQKSQSSLQMISRRIRRDKCRDVEMFFKELEKEGVSSRNISLQSEKVSFKEIWWYLAGINFFLCE